jgi:nitrogen fixation protein FixH
MTSKRNLWPLGVILAFALFIPATAGLIVLACTHKEDLVNASYYEQEIKFQGQLDRLSRTRELGAQSSVTYDTGAKHIRISLPAEHARQHATGLIQLYRPSEAGLDRQLPLLLDATGSQLLAAAALRPGLWKVRVSWTAGGMEYALDEKVVIGK